MRHPFKQGLFKPLHPEKYTGSLPVVYRSSLELQMFRVFDNSNNVIKWGSESVILPYISPKDNKLHRYYVDNNITLRQKDGSIQKYLVEIKPFRQTQPPNTKNRKNKSQLLYEQIQWAVNQCKWSSADQWSKKNNYKFLIITEKDIQSLFV